VGVQEVGWEGGGIESTPEYTFFYRKGNENHELGNNFYLCQNYWLSGLCPRPEFWTLEIMFPKLDLFVSSDRS
jgi:hypothetical protein